MKVLRRIISILFYLFAGMFLLSWAVMAFVGGQPNLPKVAVMGFMAAFSLVPLAIGALVSPGRRGREVGIVLLVAAGWTAFTAITMTILTMDPKFMAMMPPDRQQSFAMFNDLAFGTVFTIAMAAMGFWLVRRRDEVVPDRPD
jgi:hypothetical protein